LSLSKRIFRQLSLTVAHLFSFLCLENTEGAIKKKENSPKLATKGTPDEEKENKTQHTMCWTPLYTNKHK
jgi:hypothetical protein